MFIFTPIYRSRSDSIADDYTIELSNLNREIKQIRTTRDQTGCSCKPIKVDKLSTGKMKAELLSNGHLIGMEGINVDKLSKAELVSAVREVLKHVPMCVADNCECCRAGVGCFAEVCACIGKRGAHSQRCLNPEGAIVFDPDLVMEYRNKFLDMSTCQIID